MGKKFIMQDGKKVYLADEDIKEELTEKEEADSIVEKIASDIESRLGLKDLKEKVGNIDALEKTKAKAVRKSKILTLDMLSEKSIDQLTAREGLAVFLKAAIDFDKVKLKALAEGVAADGGNLFPDEFRAELIRDIENLTIMRPLVRVIPMSKDVMKIPSLSAKPKVYWTLENQAKTTTTADFGQETLTAFKMAAINAIKNGRTILRSIVKNRINCWDILTTRTISSQAFV